MPGPLRWLALVPELTVQTRSEAVDCVSDWGVLVSDAIQALGCGRATPDVEVMLTLVCLPPAAIINSTS
ncbi:MAG: hypothetical protein IT323_01710 [Anaerolineae bacterium]|nr:hypothetical protein [Anaerolineae bacterium]